MVGHDSDPEAARPAQPCPDVGFAAAQPPRFEAQLRRVLPPAVYGMALRMVRALQGKGGDKRQSPVRPPLSGPEPAE